MTTTTDAKRVSLTVYGGRNVGYGVAEVGPRGAHFAGPFSGPRGYKKAERLAEAWNAMPEAQRKLADDLFAALEAEDPFAPDAPNLNAWPQPDVRRELAMWLAARCEVQSDIARPERETERETKFEWRLTYDAGDGAGGAVREGFGLDENGARQALARYASNPDITDLKLWRRRRLTKWELV